MSLPRNNNLTYKLVIPSNKKEVRFSPFRVAEQKELLIAHQSEDLEIMINTLKSVIKSCLKTEVDVDGLAIFDLEYIFAQIRSKSTSEISEMILPCDEELCKDNDKARVKIELDLSKLEVKFPEGHTNKFHLYDSVGVIMKYPDIKLLAKLEKIDSEAEAMFDIVMDSIDVIYDSEELHYSKDYTKEDLIDFLDDLSTDQFKSIIQFFQTMPKLEYNVSYTCPVCNKLHNKNIEGLANFF